MNLCKALFFVIVGLVFMFVGRCSWADVDLSANHRFVSARALETGNEIVLDLTIINTGNSALRDITVIQTAPLTVSDSKAESLSLTSLPVGASTTERWKMSVLTAIDQMESMMSGDIYLSVEAIDEKGESVHLEFSSKGGVK